MNSYYSRFADRFGRRVAYLIACFMISFGGFLSGASPSLPWLLFFRFIVGFGVGGLTVPFDLLAEFIPSTHRGKYLNYIEIFGTVGSLFVSGIAWGFLSTKGWRILAYTAAVPVTISSILSLIYIPESPRWLMLRGRTAEAENIVRHVSTMCNHNIGPIRLKSIANNSPTSEGQGSQVRFYELLKSPQALRVIFPLWIVWISFGFAYFGLVLFISLLYTTTSDDSPSCSFDYAPIFINACGEFAGVALGVILIDRAGRRWTQSSLYFLAAIAVFCMGFGLPAAGLVTIAWFARLFAMASSCATWVATPELFPTEMRATGHSMCNIGARAGACKMSIMILPRSFTFAIQFCAM